MKFRNIGEPLSLLQEVDLWFLMYQSLTICRNKTEAQATEADSFDDGNICEWQRYIQLPTVPVIIHDI